MSSLRLPGRCACVELLQTQLNTGQGLAKCCHQLPPEGQRLPLCLFRAIPRILERCLHFKVSLNRDNNTNLTVPLNVQIAGCLNWSQQEHCPNQLSRHNCFLLGVVGWIMATIMWHNNEGSNKHCHCSHILIAHLMQESLLMFIWTQQF